METLFQNNISIEDIARVLDRTPRAVELALKNLLIQQTLHSNSKNVSKKYNLELETMYRELAPEKYYLTKKKDDAIVIVIFAFIVYFVVLLMGMYFEQYDTIAV